MDVDIALYTLDQFSRDESVSLDTVREAARLVSYYVDFLELFSAADAVACSRKDLQLIETSHPQADDLLAVVTVHGRDYQVGEYNHALDGTALRLAERDLAARLALRVQKRQDETSLTALSSVISAARP